MPDPRRSRHTTVAPSMHNATMALSGAVIFLASFLLFLVQPILARLILPRFGGNVAVWATCLVFFQTALLAGYALAHQLVRRGDAPRLRALHIVLLLCSLALLPIVPLRGGTDFDAPSVQILLLLLATIGVPFMLLATTSPLLQAWIAAAPGAASPYRLFAVSNLASLGALLAYPWLIEPWLSSAAQARVWSLAYLLYVLLLCALALRRPNLPAPAAAHSAAPPGLRRSLGWMALSFLGSYELVAVTNHLTQNIPSFPMMWVLPLGVYLLSFTLCFDNDRWYRQRPYALALLVGLLAMSAMLFAERRVTGMGWNAGVFLAGLFVACMFCHGELARSRPAPHQLTHFYLCVSAGGVIGGASVALLAPALLSGYFEVEIGLVLLALALCARGWRLHGLAPWALGTAVLCMVVTAVLRIEAAYGDVVTMSRNFHGVLRIVEYGDATEPELHERALLHGRIMHGQQFLSAQRRQRPTGYYTETSGIGRLLRSRDTQPLEVGVVGLGAGTLAAYGRPGDHYRFYEIDAAVMQAAKQHFSFIADTPARVDIAIGDGRLLLQAEPARRFDVLVVDAFSGDSIPVHLLTREAVALYRQRIAADGVIALHLSNSHLDLRPVVANVAAALGLHWTYIEDDRNTGIHKASSDWMLLAAERSSLDRPGIREAASALPTYPPARVWTDDYSNILQVLSFGSARAAH